jgi:hypothetical protein
VLILADSYWQRNSTAVTVVVAVAVGAITLLVMWLWRHRDRQSKTLDYRVISDIAIVRSHNRPEKLRVVYGPLEVKDPRVTEVRFKNAGKLVIEAEDFLEPMVMARPNARILDFDVVEQSEKNLFEKIEHVLARDDSPEFVQLFPKTLNPGDWLTVQLLYDGGASEDPLTVTGRIKGETRKPAVYATSDDRARQMTRAVAYLATVAAVAAAAVLTWSAFNPKNDSLQALPLILMFVFSFALLYILEQSRSESP